MTMCIFSLQTFQVDSGRPPRLICERDCLQIVTHALFSSKSMTDTNRQTLFCSDAVDQCALCVCLAHQGEPKLHTIASVYTGNTYIIITYNITEVHSKADVCQVCFQKYVGTMSEQS